jgi:hypothetical protein
MKFKTFEAKLLGATVLLLAFSLPGLLAQPG